MAHPTVATDLLLKVTPPRVPRYLITRSGLQVEQPSLRDRPVILVQAPAGFGKTSLLAQWRREHLAHGTAVAWLSAQARDEPTRFLQSLALAVRVGIARPAFAHVLLDSASTQGFEGVTIWLAELAQAAMRVVLIVDEAERLPASTRELLAYVLHNAPPNLQCIVAARADCQLGLQDLVAYGHALAIGVTQLRFGLAETLALVRSRFGDAIDSDEAARLHEMTEGWPLGLQLALSVVDSAGSPANLRSLDLHGGALREQFVAYLLGSLASSDLEFLTRVSFVGNLHPEFAQALLDDPGAPERLARLVIETPVFVVAEQGCWLRMHSLAREALRRRFEALPAGERSALHARAADWLAQHEMPEAAAMHALAAGQDQQAYELAERSLYESTMRQGHQAVVLQWLGRLPPAELDRRPRLMLAAAWALATSERHDEAASYVDRILAAPGTDDQQRCECALVLGGAAIFADDPDRFARLHDPWAAAPPLKDPWLLQIHTNRTAFRELLGGEPALARLRQQQGPRSALTEGSYLGRWGDFIVGLSYVWEGQVGLAEKILRPVLAAAEADLGRRSSFASMIAALLASAVWEQDQPEEAAALLANRLDVLERSALPECVVLGYRTLARMALARQQDDRALELLGAMAAVGAARKLPRLCIASLAEQVRLHGRSARPDACSRLCSEIDALIALHGPTQGPLWLSTVELLQALAQAYAALAAEQWRAALKAVQRAEAMAQSLRQGRVHIELLGLRALALDRTGEDAGPILREALELAQSHGLKRVFDDAHPALAAWVRELAAEKPAARPAAAPARTAVASRVTPSMALTPKEREVLELLARNLSNKEIGRAMEVGETIKWHLKNLFAKLDAGTRKQVVARARILGLLAEAA